MLFDCAVNQGVSRAVKWGQAVVGVAVDGDGKVHVLNRGDGNNGTLLTFDSVGRGGNLLATRATGLVNAAGIALDPLTGEHVDPYGGRQDLARLDFRTRLRGQGVAASLADPDHGEPGRPRRNTHSAAPPRALTAAAAMALPPRRPRFPILTSGEELRRRRPVLHLTAP